MPTWILVGCLCFLCLAVYTHPKWSYKVWYEECERTVIPWTGKKRGEL